MSRHIQILIAVFVLLHSSGCCTLRCFINRLDLIGKNCCCRQDATCCHQAYQPVAPPPATHPLPPPAVQYAPSSGQVSPVFTTPIAQLADPRIKDELDDLKKEHEETQSELHDSRDTVKKYERELETAKTLMQSTQTEISALRNQQLEDRMERNRIDAKYREVLTAQEIAIQKFESRLQQMLLQCSPSGATEPIKSSLDPLGKESYLPPRYR